MFVTVDGRPPSGAGIQPRRLALLAVLASVGDRGVSRGELLGLLWPDIDEERRGQSLAQALNALRKDLGSEEAISGDAELRLSPALVTSDVAEFEAAFASAALERGVELYRGPFLEGFHLPGSEPFERWLHEQRSLSARRYRELLTRLATRARERGDRQGAIGWLRRLAALDPLIADVAADLMRALEESGDIEGALQHARVYQALVRQDPSLTPDATVVELADRLSRTERDHHPNRTEVAEGEIVASPDDQAPSVTRIPPMAVPVRALPRHPGSISSEDLRHVAGRAAPLPRTSASIRHPARVGPETGRYAILIASVVLVGALTYLASRSWHAARGAGGAGTPPVIAVGQIVDRGKEGVGDGTLLADMVATNLARIGELRVISQARMVELEAIIGGAADSTVSAAAARACRPWAARRARRSRHRAASPPNRWAQPVMSSTSPSGALSPSGASRPTSGV